ncbi:MAG: M56 family metallopeptidase [Steroidobacteraceae bacterium]
MIAVALEAAVRSAVLILLVGAALAALRVRNPHALKAAWTIVVIASLGMPLAMQIHLAPLVTTPMLDWTVDPGGAAPARAVDIRFWGAVVYLIPAIVLLWRNACALRRLWRIRRDSPAPSGVSPAPWVHGLDVRVSERIASPATFGTTILLPTDYSVWGRPTLAAVIAHEGAHVRHRDCYALWLARLHACIFWFNPLAWWIMRRLAILAEQTSDEAAVHALGNGIDYAEILLELGARGTTELATAMAASNLPARIDRILAGRTLSPALRRSQLALICAAVLPAVALAAGPFQLIATQSAYSGQAAAGTGPLAPRILSWVPLSSYYPRAAMRRGIEGTVCLAVTLDSAGRATDTRIISEDPLEMGFGAAASAAAHAMRYRNPTGHAVTFTVQIKFALSHAPADQ